MGSCHFLIPWTPSNLWSATIYVLGIINRTLGLNFNLTSRPPLGDISRFPPSKIRRSDLCGKCYRETYESDISRSLMDRSYFFLKLSTLLLSFKSTHSCFIWPFSLSHPPPTFSLSSCFFPFIVNISITLPRFRSATRVILTTICIYSENQSVARKINFIHRL